MIILWIQALGCPYNLRNRWKLVRSNEYRWMDSTGANFGSWSSQVVIYIYTLLLTSEMFIMHYCLLLLWIPTFVCCSKIPKKYVVQFPSNGNPPTLLLVIRGKSLLVCLLIIRCREQGFNIKSTTCWHSLYIYPDLINGIRTEKFSKAERDEVLSFLDRAFVRLDAWFKWFNTSQIGNNMESIPYRVAGWFHSSTALCFMFLAF